MGVSHWLAVGLPPDLRLQPLLFHPSPRKAVRSLLRLARPPVPGFLDALSFSFIVCASNGHLLRSSCLLSLYWDRNFSCCHQGVPTARLGSPTLRRGLQYWLQASPGHGQVTSLCPEGFLPGLATHFLLRPWVKGLPLGTGLISVGRETACPSGRNARILGASWSI